MTAKAIYNSQKKHSVRYDIFVEHDGKDVVVGSLYWPKALGKAPDRLDITEIKKEG